MQTTLSQLPIAHFPIRVMTADTLADTLLDRLHAGHKTALFFANTNFIVKNRPLLDRLYDPSIIIVNDGIGLDMAAKMVHGRRFPQNLNGTDFTPYLFGQSVQPLRIFLVGAKPHVLTRAVNHVRDRLWQNVVGWRDGFEGMQDPKLIEAINAAQPDVVLVAMGNPVQEKWILDHREQLNARLMIGVGALFDFWAGEKPRAPAFVQKCRLEWLYRLALEPRRLLRRYTVDILVFFMLCHRYREMPKVHG